MRRSVAEY